MTGRIAYIQNDAAFVAPANTSADAAPPSRLPDSRGARFVTISPAGDGTVLFFVPPPGRANPDTYVETVGRIARPPYRSSRALPAPLNKADVFRAVWTPDGRSVALGGYVGSGLNVRYTLATDRAEPLPHPLDSVSGDGGGRVWAFATQEGIGVRFATDGRERMLFSSGKPEPLFDALRRAKNPKNLRELTGNLSDRSLWGDKNNWSFGVPAIAPDGKSVFFAANAGQGMGAQGNTLWGLFVVDVATGKIRVLSRLGARFGRTPHVCSVDSTGERLLFVTSIHASGWDNSAFVHVVHLPTQSERELLYSDPKVKNLANSVSGACWSPDGKTVAVSAAFFDEEKARRAFAQSAFLPAHNLRFYDAVTGRPARRSSIPGATNPAWGR